MNRHVTIISPEITFTGYFQELFAARRVLGFLAGREILSRYRQTFFGLLWAAFQPLSMMLILTLVYKRYIASSHLGMPYSLFVLTGLLPWQLFARTVESSAISPLMHKNLLTKIYIPRIFIPLGNSIAGLIDAAFGMFILLLVMAWEGIMPQWTLIFMPVFLLYSFYCALGIGLILAVLNVRYRDVQYGIPFLVRLTFFFAPVSYPVSAIPHKWLAVYFLDPLSGVLELTRWSVSGGPVYVKGVLISFLISTLLFLFAIRMFRRMEFKMVDLM